MAKLVISTCDQSTTTYIVRFINATVQTRKLKMVVQLEYSKITITGESQVVTYMKQWIITELQELIEMQGKIEPMLKNVEEAQITEE